jgi:hypothetical protein
MQTIWAVQEQQLRPTAAKQPAEAEHHVSPIFAATPVYGDPLAARSPKQSRGTAPSWAMPWQTGDRAAGQQMAAALRAPRVPGGGFSNLDLPKAP